MLSSTDSTSRSGTGGRAQQGKRTSKPKIGREIRRRSITEDKEEAFQVGKTYGCFFSKTVYLLVFTLILQLKL